MQKLPQNWLGYTLDELDNDITKVTPASFEPTIDYVVTKIPRFAFEKFPGSEPYLTTAMKSVGEVMSIGRTFHESLQKALASMETGLTGFDEIEIPGSDDTSSIINALSKQTPDRILTIAQAMRLGVGNDDIQAVTMYDPWFIERIREIIDTEENPKNRITIFSRKTKKLKNARFTDARLAKITGSSELDVRKNVMILE